MKPINPMAGTDLELEDYAADDQFVMQLMNAGELDTFVRKQKAKTIAKGGGLSGAFGDRKKRQAQLVHRLKRRRKYGVPVKGGTGKQPGRKKKRNRKRLAGNLLRRRSSR